MATLFFLYVRVGEVSGEILDSFSTLSIISNL
jgi:hypothetical protein